MIVREPTLYEMAKKTNLNMYIVVPLLALIVLGCLSIIGMLGFAFVYWIVSLF